MSERKAKLESAEAEQMVAGADLQLARARLARAEAAVQATRIVSPISGIVTQRNVNEGDFVRSAALASGSPPLFTILRTDPIRVVVEVPESLVPLLEKGLPATVEFPALGTRFFKGTVSRIAVAVRRETGTLRAEVDLPNPDGQIRPGMSGLVKLVLQEGRGRPVLPLRALLPSPRPESGQGACFRVVDGRAVKVTFMVDPKDVGPEGLTVSSGLNIGDVVIIDPVPGPTIQSGEPVEPELVVEPENGPAHP